MANKVLLVTGAAGFVGSHTTLELLLEDYDVVAVDNLCNSSEESLHRVQKIANKPLSFYKGGLEDEALLTSIFSKHKISAVLHFAGLKASGESIPKALQYYDNNIVGTLVLLRVMRRFGVNSLVFSSSATVYGDPVKVPITEDCPLSGLTPYARTKLFIETILKDLSIAEPSKP
jgi:UDP-glucose 4-epimerase